MTQTVLTTGMNTESVSAGITFKTTKGVKELMSITKEPTPAAKQPKPAAKQPKPTPKQPKPTAKGPGTSQVEAQTFAVHDVVVVSTGKFFGENGKILPANANYTGKRYRVLLNIDGVAKEIKVGGSDISHAVAIVTNN